MVRIEKRNLFLEKILPRLGCHVFPGRAKGGEPHLSINNATFEHWTTTWTSILELPEKGALPSDNFLRQDKICSITIGTSVIGMISASFFDLKQSGYRSHSYLTPFLKQNGFQEFLVQQERPIMSIEYLSVDPLYRKEEMGLSLGSVLLGLAMEIFRQSESPLVLGTARSKIHVDEMCYSFGFVPVGEMEKYGHPCTLIKNSPVTLRRHQDEMVDAAVRRLWGQREDYFGLSTREKIAA